MVSVFSLDVVPLIKLVTNNFRLPKKEKSPFKFSRSQCSLSLIVESFFFLSNIEVCALFFHQEKQKSSSNQTQPLTVIEINVEIQFRHVKSIDLLKENRMISAVSYGLFTHPQLLATSSTARRKLLIKSSFRRRFSIASFVKVNS